MTRRAPTDHARECKGQKKRGKDGRQWHSRKVQATAKRASHYRWFPVGKKTARSPGTRARSPIAKRNKKRTRMTKKMSPCYEKFKKAKCPIFSEGEILEKARKVCVSNDCPSARNFEDCNAQIEATKRANKISAKLSGKGVTKVATRKRPAGRKIGTRNPSKAFGNRKHAARLQAGAENPIVTGNAADAPGYSGMTPGYDRDSGLDTFNRAQHEAKENELKREFEKCANFHCHANESAEDCYQRAGFTVYGKSSEILNRCRDKIMPKIDPPARRRARPPRRFR